MGDLYNLASTDELVRILECPICTEVPLPPILSCEKGHFICGNCRAQMQRCGLCQSPFSSARNYPLEAIVNSSTFKCKHEIDGCKERVKGGVYAEHIKACDYRPAICNHSTKKKCQNQAIPVRTFVGHLVEGHGLSQMDMSADGVRINEMLPLISNSADRCFKWPLISIKFDNRFFFLRKMLNKDTFSIWVTAFGNSELASKYKATITITSKSKSCPRIEWTIPIYSFRLTQEEALAFAHVSISFQQLKNIADNADQDGITWASTYLISHI